MMKKKSALLPWLIGFIILNLYANGIPKLVQLDTLTWPAYAAGFFILAYLLGRFLLGFKGLSGYGLPLQKTWLRDVGMGFALGATVWGIKYLAFYGLGKFDVVGVMEPGFIVGMLTQALVVMLVASAINDMVIRGYWFAYLQEKNRLQWFVLLTTVLYALDDVWNEGFGWQNMVFSALIGLALAYTVLKTQAIWMAVGIHWGGNMLYRIMAGFDGQGIWKLTNETDGPLYEYVGLCCTALLLPIVYGILRQRHSASVQVE